VNEMQDYHATTIVCVRRDGRVAMGGDGQVTLGDKVMKDVYSMCSGLAKGPLGVRVIWR